MALFASFAATLGYSNKPTHDAANVSAFKIFRPKRPTNFRPNHADKSTICAAFASAFVSALSPTHSPTHSPTLAPAF